MKPMQRQKLLVGFTAVDFIADLNQYLKESGTKLILDFEDKKRAFLIAEDNNNYRTIASANRRFTTIFPHHIVEIAKDHGGKLLFAVQKPFNKKQICKIQFHVESARNIALTMAETVQGTKEEVFEFLLPGEET